MALTVTHVTPNYTIADDVVNVYGTDFVAGATVFFGATAATEVVVHNPNHITCKVPPGTGLVDITVTTP